MSCISDKSKVKVYNLYYCTSVQSRFNDVLLFLVTISSQIDRAFFDIFHLGFRPKVYRIKRTPDNISLRCTCNFVSEKNFRISEKYLTKHPRTVRQFSYLNCQTVQTLTYCAFIEVKIQADITDSICIQRSITAKSVTFDLLSLSFKRKQK